MTHLIYSNPTVDMSGATSTNDVSQEIIAGVSDGARSREPTVLPGEPEQSVGEEIANSVTHGVGFGLAIAGFCVLLAQATFYGHLWRVVSCTIYGVTLMVMYGASTIYHSVRVPRIKRVLRIFDHIAVYLLIAGTYTPFTLVTLRGDGGWTLFGVVWGLCCLGIVYKISLMGRFEKLSTLFYLGMGWLVVAAIKPLFETLPAAGLALILGGGLFYTVGVAFYVKDDDNRFYHTIWHLFVLAGSFCHYLAILYYVIPPTHHVA